MTWRHFRAPVTRQGGLGFQRFARALIRLMPCAFVAAAHYVQTFTPPNIRKPMMLFRTFLISLIAASTLCGGRGAAAADVTVFAASSLKTALDDVARQYEARTGLDVAISYAGSSVLARQIQHGAPADLFVSANADWMDVLEADGLLVAGSRVDLLGNTLVLVAHDTDAPVSLTDPTALATRLGEGYLAMALVDAVPAGMYGKAALVSLGLWGSVRGQVAQSDNVRAALALVASGEAPYGIVYATDAQSSDCVHVVAHFPQITHPPIVYPMAEIAGQGGAATQSFREALMGETARATFQSHGFIVMEHTP
ncbi:molybdate ABC transporter substrate-binding protein [Celeribacter marinus]|uniref:molybdate ABC transporter substrate-binding protein n=1 Tax=Celeribacter marinus TaxID=1397108 RepID=UPI00316B26A6